MAPVERQDQGLSIGVLVDVWVVLVRELQVSDFRQFTEEGSFMGLLQTACLATSALKPPTPSVHTSPRSSALHIASSSSSTHCRCAQPGPSSHACTLRHQLD